MKENWVCKQCGDPYEIGAKPYYGEGDVCFCADCYANLIKEKLPYRKIESIIKKKLRRN